MSPHQDSATRRLLQSSLDVMQQALALVAGHELPGASAYISPVGVHLCLVIEHYEALLYPTEPGSVDYDQRPRNGKLERFPAVARARLEALQSRLLNWTDAQFTAPLQVRGLGGLDGDFEFTVRSCGGRELVFLVTHAIHHFAMLQAHCQQHGIPVHAQFGRAPATVAHERAAQPGSAQHAPQESTWHAISTSIAMPTRKPSGARTERATSRMPTPSSRRC